MKLIIQHIMMKFKLFPLLISLAFVMLLSWHSNAQSRFFVGNKTPGGFESEINDYLRQDSLSFPASGAYLFTGSSSIRLWDNFNEDFKGMTVINRGFGGSTMNALNYYLDYIVLPYKPIVIVVYEGDNDLEIGITPAEFVSQCDTFIKRVHAVLPKTMIYFISVKPSFARMNQIAIQDKANAELKKLTQKSKNTGFLDIRPLMYDKKGQLRHDFFKPDSLHVNAACYRAWADFIRKKIRLKK